VEHRKTTTKSFIEKIPVLYFEKGKLNKCVKYFVRVLIKHGIPQRRNFAFLMKSKRRSQREDKPVVSRIFTIFEKCRVINAVQFRIRSHQTMDISKQSLGIPSAARY
jgi:hypothetical protein